MGVVIGYRRLCRFGPLFKLDYLFCGVHAHAHVGGVGVGFFEGPGVWGVLAMEVSPAGGLGPIWAPAPFCFSLWLAGPVIIRVRLSLQEKGGGLK